MANYGKPEYWEDRYQKDKEQFDWLQRYDNPTGMEVFRNIINKYVQPNDTILVPFGRQGVPWDTQDGTLGSNH